MADSEVIKNLGTDIEKFDRKVNDINLQNDVYQNKRVIDELENMYKNLLNRADECDNDLQDSSQENTKPLMNKLVQYKRDLEIANNKFNAIKAKWQTAYNIEKLKVGELRGPDKEKAERDLALELHKETDYQGNIIDSIANNIKGANRNLEGINIELKEQGGQINRIQDHVAGAETQVKHTEKIFAKMERREICMKIVGFVAVIVLGIFDLIWLVYWIVKDK